MSHVLLRVFGALWHGLSLAFVLPLCLVMVSLSLDELLLLYTGVDLSPSWWLQTAGLLFILSAAILAGISWWTLWSEGKGYPWAFGNHVAYNPQRLVTSGPYSMVRHPVGLSYILLLLGLGCLTSSLTMLVWIVPLMGGLLYEYFEFTEEIKLRQWFSEEYERYHTTTPSLLPWRASSWSSSWARARLRPSA